MTNQRQSANTFTATDATGAQVSFDTDSGKWAAEWNGKKTSSLKYETVRDKINTWKADAERLAANIVPADPIELTMLMVSAQDHQLKSTWQEGSAIKVVPVQLKVVWNEETGAPKILKYRPMDGASGWKQYNAENLLLVDPFNMASEHQALFVEHLRNRVLRQAYDEVEYTLATQWAATKPASHHYVTLKGDQLVAFDGEPQGRNKPDWRHAFSVSPAWPTSVNADIELKPDHGWEVDKDGAWTQGNGSVRVKLALGAWGSPSFVVEQRVDELWHPLLTDGSFEVALALAEATMRLEGSPEVSQWTGTEGWMNRTRGSKPYWPKPVATVGAVVVSKKTGEETMYTLQRTEPERAPHLQDNKAPSLAWVAYQASQYSSSAPASLWPAGPEDAVFEHLAMLRVEMGKLQDASGDVKTQLSSFAQDTLSQAFGDATNGEAEPRTVEQVQARWARLVERWTRQAADSKDTQVLQECCDLVLADTAGLLTPPTPAKRPKP